MTLPTAVSSPPPSLDSVPPLGSPGVQAAGRRASLVIFLLQFALNALGAAGGLPLIAVVTPHRAELGLQREGEELRPPPGQLHLNRGLLCSLLVKERVAEVDPLWPGAALGLHACSLHNMPGIEPTLRIPC